MRNCNGCCAFCGSPCYRGEIKGNQRESEEISLNSIPQEVEKKASQVFDEAIPQSTEVALVDIPTYEVTKNIFGKEKVRRIK